MESAAKSKRKSHPQNRRKKMERDGGIRRVLARLSADWRHLRGGKTIAPPWKLQPRRGGMEGGSEFGFFSMDVKRIERS